MNLYDLSSGRRLESIKDGQILVLNPVRPEAAYRRKGQLTLRDLQRQIDLSVITLPLEDGVLVFGCYSADGKRLALQTLDRDQRQANSWATFTSDGKPLHGWSPFPAAAFALDFFPDGSRVMFGSSKTTVVLDSVSGRTLASRPSGPGSSLNGVVTGCFSADSKLWAQPDWGSQRIKLVNTSDLSTRALLWGPTEQFSFSQDCQYLSASGGSRDGGYFPTDSAVGTWVYQLRSPVPEVGEEDQQLLSELWTGMRLRGGMAPPMTPDEYRYRRDTWKAKGGGEWGTHPRSLRRRAWNWTPVAMIGFLVGLWVAYGWRNNRARNRAEKSRGR